MKKIIAIALIMCATTVSAQLTTQRFSPSDELLTREISNETAKWLIYDNNTPTYKGDDVLKQFIYDEHGKLTNYREGKIESTERYKGTFTLKVIGENNQWYNVVFWEKDSGENEPLVAYEYSDGYMLFSGDVQY